MPLEHFVGRQDLIATLTSVLQGGEQERSRLAVQSIEGPGGIGKTYLFDHVLASNPLDAQNYLTLRMDGNDPASNSLIRAVSRMVDSAQAPAIRNRPPGYYFHSVARVTRAMEAIREEALAEFQKEYPDSQEGQAALSHFLDTAFGAGKRINESFPITQQYVRVGELEKVWRKIDGLLPHLASLREESIGLWERIGIGREKSLRNAIRENACRPLSDALVSDLTAMLQGYRREDKTRATKTKVKGIDRLLLILDDYEKLQATLGEFLVGYLLPALKSAGFQTRVIILGRDQLEATHPAWDQHLKSILLKRIVLHPLSRAEMDTLVESYGVQAQEEKERAWRDTEGYPFYVQLWCEETESGGRSAVMLKRFYDRTTRWMSDKEKEWLQYTLFLDEVNIRSLQSVLPHPEEAEAAFRWFECEGSVRDTVGSAFRVREYLRSRLIDYLRASDPARCEALERKTRHR